MNNREVMLYVGVYVCINVCALSERCAPVQKCMLFSLNSCISCLFYVYNDKEIERMHCV